MNADPTTDPAMSLMILALFLFLFLFLFMRPMLLLPLQLAMLPLRLASPFRGGALLSRPLLALLTVLLAVSVLGNGSPDTSTVPDGANGGQTLPSTTVPNQPNTSTGTDVGDQAGSTTVEQVLATWRVRVQTHAQSRVIPEAALAEAARRCLLLQAAAPAVPGASDCATGRVVVVGGADAMQIAQFDAQAIAAVPAWRQLTYLNSKAKFATGVPRKWYDQVQYDPATGGGCAREHRTTTTLLADCQEYPYYTTVEGGPQTGTGRPPARVGLLNGRENQIEGRAYTAMVNDPRCGLKTAQPGTATFLVVPIPEPTIASFYLCP